MKIPKYIDDMLSKRATYAAKLMDVDYKLSQWLDKNGVSELLEDFDYRTGVEIYSNPYASADRVREAIRRKGNETI